MIAFFSENGLTSTSASYIANLANEYVQNCKKELNSINYYSKYISTINGSPRLVSEGISNIDITEYEMQRLEAIGEANSLIAWLNEAVKTKDKLIKYYRYLSGEDYEKETGISCPKLQEATTVLLPEEDIVNSWDIKKRNHYYELQAKASAYGTFIHRDKPLSIAREKLQSISSNPIQVDEVNGNDTIIWSYEPTVSIEEVENSFFTLQQKQRSYQAELNSMKHEIEVELHKNQRDRFAEEDRLNNEYNLEYKKYINTLDNYRKTMEYKVSSYKIVIPDSLRNIYEQINKLGKK